MKKSQVELLDAIYLKISGDMREEFEKRFNVDAEKANFESSEGNLPGHLCGIGLGS